MTEPIVPTDRPPDRPSRLIDDFAPSLVNQRHHDLCPGCGEPIAIRSLLETIEQVGATKRSIAVMGIGCYTAFSSAMDIEVLQALHGRAPSLATGVKRMRPDAVVVTIQGDGDMVNEGLQEVLHSAARGENITCIMLNNGVFGETGGHMTATTVLGQRTKNSIEGRRSDHHGFPISLAELVAGLAGTSFVARGAVSTAGEVARTRRMLQRAIEVQLSAGGFGLVEILTMCPTGWFIDTTEAPSYLMDTLAGTHHLGVVKDTPRP